MHPCSIVTHRHAFVRITKLHQNTTDSCDNARLHTSAIYAVFWTGVLFLEFRKVPNQHEAHCRLQRRQTVYSAFIFYSTEIERVFGASLNPTTRTAGASRLIMLHFLHVCLLRPQQIHFCNNPYGRKTATDAAHHTATCQSSLPSNDVPSPEPSLEI